MLRVLLLVFQCYFLSIISVIRKKQVSETNTLFFERGFRSFQPFGFLFIWFALQNTSLYHILTVSVSQYTVFN